MECRIQQSIHAKDRMIERGISKSEILETINKGVKRLDGKNIITFHRRIKVVYRKKTCHIFVITVY